MIRTKDIVGLEERAERSITTKKMYKLLEERGVRPTSIDVRQMKDFGRRSTRCKTARRKSARTE
ncbi:MAG: hypothetical protein ACRD5E_07940 [Nitrososphaeraceae archaeon]